MFRFIVVLYFVFVFLGWVNGQGHFSGLYDFAACSTKDSRGKLVDINVQTIPTCLCGTDNEAIDMVNNYLFLDNSFDSIFKGNFTICFDVFIENVTNDVDLISKSYKCNSDTSLNITYRVRDSLFSIFLQEGFDESYRFFAHADPRSCWQSICLTVNGIDIRAYVNGVERGKIVANDLLRLDNKEPITFNKSNCQNAMLNSLQGRLDRIILANYPMTRDEIQSNFIPQQRVLTQDTIIFLGEQFELRANSNCPSLISWNPNIALSSNTILNPICNPTKDVLYNAEFRLGRCNIKDTVLVRVVDKDKLECKDLRLPTAFTPNSDNINDEFFISNPYILSELKLFDILDRNGGIVFSTTNITDKWDGTFKGKLLNPGTFFYRVEYTCKNEDYQTRGSVMLMR